MTSNHRIIRSSKRHPTILSRVEKLTSLRYFFLSVMEYIRILHSHIFYQKEEKNLKIASKTSVKSAGLLLKKLRSKRAEIFIIFSKKFEAIKKKPHEIFKKWILKIANKANASAAFLPQKNWVYKKNSKNCKRSELWICQIFCRKKYLRP